jgi:uncharacterized Ntn-hydrolase superfamily protein
MRRSGLVSLLSIALTASVISSVPLAASVQTSQNPEEPWFSTFSIVAFDPATKDLGVAVASRPVGAGAAVNWAEAGIGAIATQAGANRTYGPKAIALLKQGLSPAEIVKKITDEDPGRESRQVAVIDMQGRTAVFTSKTILSRGSGTYAGSIEGKNFSVQGNTLASEEVIKAMAAAYEAGVDKPIEERLMDALDAGNAKGGDARGMGSAGILVVRPVAPDNITSIGRRVDLRVDHSLTDPFKELRRILNMNSLSGHYTRLSSELAAQGKFAEALSQQRKALDMNPASAQAQYAFAQRSAQAGEYLNALLALQEALKLQANLKAEALKNPVFDKMKDMIEFRRLVGSN